MSKRGRGPSETSHNWTRRAYLKATLLGAGALGLRIPASGSDDPVDATAEVQAQAEKAGLGPFRSSVTKHYLGIGDATDDFRADALKLCEALATAYQKYFQDKGFAVNFPARRLTVVALKDRSTYAKFLGEAPGNDVGGHYDLDTNQLVMFDFRPGKGEDAAPGAAVAPERLNTITLVHEATHQLTFNTGLLDRQADVPLALSEGLAMYTELWRPGPRSTLGIVHRYRLQVISEEARDEDAWISAPRLLTEDTLFEGEKTAQLAYSEAWALVNSLLKTPAALPRFRAYLEAIRPRRTPSERLADATTHLGNLDALNQAVRKHCGRLIRQL